MENKEKYEINQKGAIKMSDNFGICGYCNKILSKNKKGDFESIYLDVDCSELIECSKDFCSLDRLKGWIKDNPELLEEFEDNDIMIIFSSPFRQELINLLK